MAKGRVRERDLFVPALGLAADRPGGFISTADLIAELAELFQPHGDDAAVLEGRLDTRFSQKVRNLISHRESSTSFIKKGFAEYVETGGPNDRGIRITEKGRALLAQIDDTQE